MNNQHPHNAAIAMLAQRAAALALPLMLLASCSMMKEDRSDCPTCKNPLHLVLKYDYNIQRANMYADHVQQAKCYIVDTRGHIVASDEAVAEVPGMMPSAFNFEELPEGDYRAYAVAQTPTDGARSATQPYAIANLSDGDDISLLQPRIGRADAPNADGTYDVPADLPLDTLWMGHSAHVFHLTADRAATDTVSLVRDTKNLSLMLVQIQNPTDNAADRYEVSIVDQNGWLDHDNNLQADATLRYTPYAQWTTETLADNGAPAPSEAATRADGSEVIARTAHYDLSFGRLVNHEDASKNARLIIKNKDDGNVIVDIDLVHYLALARTAYGHGYSIQEYLDREYNYQLDFVLSGNEWSYMTISVNVLSWTLRIQNTSVQ